MKPNPDCTVCEGTGYIEIVEDWAGLCFMCIPKTICRTCRGTGDGYDPRRTCSSCGGKGYEGPEIVVDDSDAYPDRPKDHPDAVPRAG